MQTINVINEKFSVNKSIMMSDVISWGGKNLWKDKYGFNLLYINENLNNVMVSRRWGESRLIEIENEIKSMG